MSRGLERLLAAATGSERALQKVRVASEALLEQPPIAVDASPYYLRTACVAEEALLEQMPIAEDAALCQIRIVEYRRLEQVREAASLSSAGEWGSEHDGRNGEKGKTRFHGYHSEVHRLLQYSVEWAAPVLDAGGLSLHIAVDCSSGDKRLELRRRSRLSTIVKLAAGGPSHLLTIVLFAKRRMSATGPQRTSHCDADPPSGVILLALIW